MAMATGLRPMRSDSRPAAMARPSPTNPPGIEQQVICQGCSDSRSADISDASKVAGEMAKPKAAAAMKMVPSRPGYCARHVAQQVHRLGDLDLVCMLLRGEARGLRQAAAQKADQEQRHRADDIQRPPAAGQDVDAGEHQRRHAGAEEIQRGQGAVGPAARAAP